MRVSNEELKEYVSACSFPDSFKYNMGVALDLMDLRLDYQELDRKYQAIKKALESGK